MILLLWGVGAAALVLVREAYKNYEEILGANYPAIKTARSFHTLTANTDAYYVSGLAGEPPYKTPERTVFDLNQGLMSAAMASLRDTNDDPAWQDVLDRLQRTLGIYSDEYEHLLEGGVETRDQADKFISGLSRRTQDIAEQCDSLFLLAEERLKASAVEERQSANNTLFVVVLVLVGTAIAVFIYYQLVRHLVDPVVGLQRSIDEIRKGNFELTLAEPGNDSEFRGVAAAFNDMAAELRLRRGETDERLMRTNLVNRAILEAIPSPVFVLGDDGRILQINPAAEALTENLGIANRLPAKIQRILDESAESGENHLPDDPREALLFRIGEREFFYLPRIFSFTSEDGVYSGRAVLLHNVTRIRWLDDMKTNLLSTVSHEVKTPLTGIRMVLHLLLEERSGKLSPIQKTMVTSANDDCERLLTTLNTLLDLSRAESGTTHLERVPVALQEALSRSERLFAPKASARNVSIHVESNGALPDVSADPVRLDEVLNNLVSNAIKHSPEGGTVTLRTSQPDADHLRVSVIDQGEGVPESSQNRIFERFFRAPGQTAEGVGLGLFICREIMRAHEGRIGLRERTEDQTEFFIDVPIA
ncbi:ATP-binding protein [Luteolibacter sp. Populi]|uniref:sensor histidine kinase n=1 Tax=Luteolibacter sp. Populi TaxID=3230487 RepID=UPI003465F824